MDESGRIVSLLLLNAHYVDWYEDCPPRLEAAMAAAAVVSHERFASAFGAQPTPHREALERMLARYRANPGYA